MGRKEWVCVRCFSCGTFQGNQKTKSNKFKCKICGKKQSITKIFAITNKSRDLRPVVQDLNSKRFDLDENPDGVMEEEGGVQRRREGSGGELNERREVKLVAKENTMWKGYEEDEGDDGEGGNEDEEFWKYTKKPKVAKKQKRRPKKRKRGEVENPVPPPHKNKPRHKTYDPPPTKRQKVGNPKVDLLSLFGNHQSTAPEIIQVKANQNPGKSQSQAQESLKRASVAESMKKVVQKGGKKWKLGGSGAKDQKKKKKKPTSLWASFEDDEDDDEDNEICWD